MPTPDLRQTAYIGRINPALDVLLGKLSTENLIRVLRGRLSEAMLDLHACDWGDDRVDPVLALRVARSIHEEYGRRVAALVEEPRDTHAFYRREGPLGVPWGPEVDRDDA